MSRHGRPHVTSHFKFSLDTANLKYAMNRNIIFDLVPTLRVGMPSSTLCVALAPIAAGDSSGRGASGTAFPRGAWERVGASRVQWKS